MKITFNVGDYVLFMGEESKELICGLIVDMWEDCVVIEYGDHYEIQICQCVDSIMCEDNMLDIIDELGGL